MHHLKDIVERWYELGVQLDLPLNKLNEIRCNNPGDVYQCKLLILQEWQRRPTLKPSWCMLVDTLRKMEETVVAEKIAQQFSELHIIATMRLCYLFVRPTHSGVGKGI